MKKQRMIKRIGAIFLTLTMVVGLLPTTIVWADEELTVYVGYDTMGGSATVNVGGTVLESDRAVSLSTISEKTIVLHSPEDRSGLTPVVEIAVHDGNNGDVSTVYRSDSSDDKKITVTGSGQNWSFTAPALTESSDLLIWWSDIDAFGYDDSNQVQICTNFLSGNASGSISFGPGITIDNNQKMVTDHGCKYNISAATAFGADGSSTLAVTFTPSDGYTMDSVVIGEYRYKVNPEENSADKDINNPENGFTNSNGAYTYYLPNTIQLGTDPETNKPFTRYEFVYFEVNFASNNSEPGGEDEGPQNVYVEFDNWGNSATVKVGETALTDHNSVDLETISGKEITIHTPNERAGVAPIVRIEIFDGYEGEGEEEGKANTVYSSEFSAGDPKKITVTGSGQNWSFNFPELTENCAMFIWWSQYDAFGYNDSNQVQIRTNICSADDSGTISFDSGITIAAEDKIETQYGNKYNISASTAFGEDKDSTLAVTFTPSDGYFVDFIRVDGECYRSDNFGDGDKDINAENSGFSKNESTGAYTYYLSYASATETFQDNGENRTRYREVSVEVNYVNNNPGQGGDNQGGNNDNTYGNDTALKIRVRDEARGTVYLKIGTGEGNPVEVTNSTQIPTSLNVGDVFTVYAKANEGEEVSQLGVWINGQAQETVNNTNATYGNSCSFTVTDASQAIEFFVEFRNPSSNNGPGGNGNEQDALQDGIQFQIKGPDRGTVNYKIGSTDYSLTNDKVLAEGESVDKNAEPISFSEDTEVSFSVIKAENTNEFEVHIDSSDESENVGSLMDAKYKKADGSGGFMAELEDGNTVAFTAQAGHNYRIRVGFGQQISEWYTVSWAGGNVKVKNGQVLAERVHVAAHDEEPAKTFTIYEDEASESDNVYYMWNTIGKLDDENDENNENNENEGEENPYSFENCGLGFSQSDLFIKTGLDGVTIDYKFIPDYGYQLGDIYTNDECTESGLSDFTPDENNVSRYIFTVKVNSNVHFKVKFVKKADTITTNDATDVTGASIANGKNAASSGNLSLTVKDTQTSATGAIKAYDLTLDNVVDKAGTSGNWTTNISEFEEPITLTLNLDNTKYKADNYQVIRTHGGVDEVIPAEYDETTGELVFKTNKFSKYTILQACHVDDDSNEICDICEKSIHTVAGWISDDAGGAVAAHMKGLAYYAESENVQLVAPIVTGYNFVGWYSYAGTVNGNITHTGTNLCTSRTYNFAMGSTALELVAVYKALGQVQVTINGGASYTINGVEKTNQHQQNYDLGKKISVECDNDNFEYWQNSAGMILSRSDTYTFTVTGPESVIAVINNKTDNRATVVFESYYGQIIARFQELENGAEKTLPELPYRNGYTAKGWDCDGDGNYNATNDTFAKALQRAFDSDDKLITIKPVYELINQQYTITVNNGTGGGTYGQNAVVTVTANAAESGQKFSHWKDDNNKILSYNETYNFYASGNITLTAVYVQESVVVEAKGTTEIIDMSKDTTDKKLVFVSMSTVPEGCTIEMAGIIATNNAGIATGGNLTASNALCVRGREWSGNAFRYTWIKTNVSDNETWYVRAYLVYTDAEGNTNTVYGDVVSQTMN